MTARRRFLIARVALAPLFVLGLAGCSSLGTEAILSAAQVRFVQVSPGSPELDFYVNGAGAAYGLGFENYTSYLPVNSGSASLSANRAGLGQSLVSAQTALSGGHQYTVLVSHGLGSLQERVYADQDTPAPAGQIALRILNEVEGAAALTVYINPTQGSLTPLATLTVAADAPTAYLSAPAGTYTISAGLENHGLTLPVRTLRIRADSGAVRTVVFAGTAAGSAHSNVVGFTLSDADAP